MGRYNLAPQRVQQHATQLLAAGRLPNPPPWYHVIGTTPPASRLVRPPLQRAQAPGSQARRGRKPSKMFKPLRLAYQEDRLRWEYFNDHPWELARPRVIVEDDGKDGEKWDWSVSLDHSLSRPRAGETDEEGVQLDRAWDEVRRQQAGRPMNGESVVQRQAYLMSTGLAPSTAYDAARKEFYRIRHAREIEDRVAREEAQASGAFFGPGPLEIGMKLEDEQYENWRAWATKEIEALKQLQGSAYTGTEVEGADGVGLGEPDAEEIQEVSEAIPASRTGQEAKGGVAVHP